ncbi:MAG: fibronectin type III domain-containing protein [Chitinophagaceae bacterium]|nr:fibronectin type III domain-containing protein [Chitinophagaceae bacterium]
MKKITILTTKVLMALLLVLGAVQSYSQTYRCDMKNITYPTPNTLEFEIWLQNMGSNTYLLQSVQMGIEFNYAGMANGGTITGSFVAGSNTLPAPQNNLTANTTVNQTSKQIRVTASIQTSSAAAAPLTSTPLKYGTFRLTNTQPFTPGSAPNFIWSFLTAANRTKSAVSCWTNGATSGASITTQTDGGTPNVSNPTAPYNYIAGPQHYIESNPVVPSTCPVITLGTTVDPTCFGGTGSVNVNLNPAAGGTYSVDGGAAQTFPSGTSVTISGLSQGAHTIVVTATGCNPETLNATIGGPTTPLTNSTTATACDSYTWSVNGLVYTQSGTYTGTSTNGQGCTVNETLNLTINNSTSNSTNATACDSYTWAVNGQTYTASGTYTNNSTNAAGCPHVETLNLTINSSTTGTSNTTACDSYTWAVNQQTYTQSGTYTYTGTNAAGCPDNQTLNLTINNSTSNSSSATACDSYTWAVNGQTYTASGTYTNNGTNAAGCPHVETLNLTINASTSNSSSATACDSYTWAVNGQTYTASGTYTNNSTNAAGCPHVETLNLTINASTSNTSSATACDSYTWAVNGQTYTASGTYTNNSTNAAGCPHVETLNLTINNSTSSTTTATACDSYTWSSNGQTYSATGSYTNTTTNAAGCPHVETLNLTINASTSNTTQATACDSYTWSVNGMTYSQSGTYTNTSTNAAGCPHVETLNLTINASTSNTTNATACGSYTWAVNGMTYTASGTYTNNGTNAAGCPHVETLNLTITTSSTNTTTVSACDSYTWAVNNQTYTASGTYTSTSGCNTEELVLTITASTSNTTTVSACDSYTWSVNNQTYTASGTYTNISGCATEELVLTITPSSQATQNETACGSYTWALNGMTYTQSGTYTSVNGCVTTTLNLTISSSINNTTTQTQCGGSYTWSVDGMTYTQSGTYTSVNGCVTETLNLTINPVPVVTAPNVGSCTGTVTLGGSPAGGTWNLPNPYSGNATSYTYFYTNQFGCSGSATGSITATNPAVTNLQVSAITGVSAQVSWNGSAPWYEVRYKVITAATWNPTVTSNSTNKPLNGLTPGTTYSVEVRGFCTTANAGAWVGTIFTTNTSCGVPSGLTVTNITATTSKLNWTAVVGANYYTVRYKKTTAITWTTGTSASNSKSIAGLAAGTNYEFQVSANCGAPGGSLNTAFSASGNWSTSTAKAGENASEAISNNINIYPNPTQNELNVDLTVTEFTNVVLKLVDMSGRVVKQIQTEAVEGVNNITLNLGDLSNGIYSLQVISNDQLTQVTRVTKN